MGNQKAGTTVFCYREFGKTRLLRSEKKKNADNFILRTLGKVSPDLVFIDAPLSLPSIYTHNVAKADYFYRLADRKLGAMSPMFLGGLTARAIQLKDEMARMGIQAIEAYPGGLSRKMNLIKSGYKGTLSNIPACLEKIDSPFAVDHGIFESWHDIDALLCYLIGLRYINGKAESFGDPEEGLTWL
jgi:predicted nuclease with RNAse H fold